MKEGSKWVELHIKWTVWMNKRMTLTSYNKNSRSDPSNTDPTTIWWLPCFFCGLGQFQVDLGTFVMKAASKRVQLHIKWTVWIHKSMMLMHYVSYSQWNSWNTLMMTEDDHVFCVEWVSSRLIWWVCDLEWKNGPNEWTYTSNQQYGSTKEWYWWISSNTVHEIHVTHPKLSEDGHVFCVDWVSSRQILVCFGWKKDPNEWSYTSNGQYGWTKEWHWRVITKTVDQIHRTQTPQLSDDCHVSFVGWVSSRLIWAHLWWKQRPKESSYTSNGQYGSTKAWCWCIMFHTVNEIHGTHLWWLRMTMFSVWSGSVPGWFDGFVIWNERTVQMSGPTHQINSMDPQKNDTDEYHQIQSMRSMEHTQKLSGDSHVFCVGWVTSRLILGVFGMKERSKWVELHIKWTVWIHKRMIMMSYRSYSPLDLLKTPKTV